MHEQATTHWTNFSFNNQKDATRRALISPFETFSLNGRGMKPEEDAKLCSTFVFPLLTITNDSPEVNPLRG
jgi:hypothetical protein